MTLRTLDQLSGSGLVDAAGVDALRPVVARYALAVTPLLAEGIGAGSTALARQYLPDARELDSAPDDHPDPIGDAAHSPVPGIVHRYPDRVLLMPLHACAVYCRFCFRRESVGPGMEALSAEDLEAALDYIRTTPAVWEVILTGGDPLILSPRRLEALIAALSAIDHVGVIRIHSRVPAADPDRITPDLVTALSAGSKAVWIAVHANHPDEMTPAVRAACGRLVDAGLPLVSQTVLLRGVNDDAETLTRLMRAFVEARIKPYYLHHLDRAPGTAHFRVPLETGQTLAAGLRGRVSGLCQPTYVLDIPGGHGKAPLSPCAAEPAGDGSGTWLVRDHQGTTHRVAPE